MSLVNTLVSLHGRRLGISSSGGLVSRPSTAPNTAIHFAEISSAGVVNSSITTMTVQELKSYVETISSSAATMVNHGLSVISSDVINVSVLKLSAPISGLEKMIYGDSSASTVSLNTTSSDITFGASVLSSAFVFDNAGGVRGTSLLLKGISTTRWALIGRKVTA